ncbi:hypothetical protein I307_00720 [Cryptococcus deuterogattii 99/473]|uniref:Uncharacterized protein n=2 Tax=Cryptococcus deuterogattii TaxID=1859096 RepID=A0A0D0U217_9TREE|nr:hypothetical protein CNBG_1437 [Cryptococcus deuterogattii R265]KIR31019.1 hypothetical protein I309_00373 [Cryptococcus deuterogattii LA55]KIR42243.1 hypothetical protein I313_01465 [Cryptococcus deuterogattii Ram5]KIR72932.1 hypothetical protein I310_03536 [Cryptococcus deuterogattii CA1014]KIR94889.1 hypothetical protein I304_01213 [Cryptococcus deuterogattii CBS 10090]KIS00591.1 hypothetical protein L804_02006 [Cryptococcus deuterogattii 2001/935-1]KIY59648.1 hypothetical protein I307_
MNPTQPNSGHRRWFAHPDFHYSISHRFRWPSYPAEGPAVASSAATGAANTVSAGAAGVAEGAAASGAFGAGGGFPPRGTYGGYHHYYDGRYPYGRPFGRRPFLRRFVWFGLGIAAATIWHRHHEQKRHGLERFITDPKCWSGMHHHRPVPATPVDFNASATTTTPPLDSNPINPSYQDSPTDDRRRWGWRTCRERKMEERRLREEALRSQAQAQSDSSNSGSHDAAHVEQKETADFQSIREAVEKLWSEKRAEANEGQKRANDKAKEYAAERLEKLTAALERLRVSLQEDSKRGEDKKLV